MSRMKALRKDEELAAVPLDQPVLVDLEPEGVTVDTDDQPEPKQVQKTEEPAKTGANVLEEQLKALQEANRLSEQRRVEAERRAETAERERVAAINSQSKTEAEAVQSGLSGAQAELAAAKLEVKRAGESGDWEALAEANARVGRASSDIREFERSAAILADRKEETPQRQVQQQPGDINAMIDGNPQLLPSEREWLKLHPEAVIDSTRNKELDVAYIKATRQGLSRGTPDYFKFIDQEMGYAKATPAAQQGDDNMSVSAPVSRNERGGDGRPTNGKIMLTPEQREIAKSMGVSDIEYARKVADFEAARKADPEKYR